MNRQYRVRIHQLGTTTPADATVEFELDVELSSFPVLGAHEIDPLRGRAQTRGFNFEVVDAGDFIMSNMADSDGKAHVLGRVVDVLINDDNTGWVRHGVGRLADMWQSTPRVWRIRVGDERSLERGRRLFESIDHPTTSLWPPSRMFNFRGNPWRQGYEPRWNLIRRQIVDGHKMVLLTMPDLLLGEGDKFPPVFVSAVQDDWQPHANPIRPTSWGFRTLKLFWSPALAAEGAGHYHRVHAFTIHDSNNMGYTPDEVFSGDYPAHLVKVWVESAEIYDAWATLLGETGNDGEQRYIGGPLHGICRLVQQGGPPTSIVPYHIGVKHRRITEGEDSNYTHPHGSSSGGIDPFSFLQLEWDALGVRYDAPALDSHKNKHPPLELSVEEDFDLKPFVEDHIFAANLVAPFYNRDGAVLLRSLEIPRGLSTSTLFRFNHTNLKGPPTWHHSETDAIARIVMHAVGIAPYTGDAVSMPSLDRLTRKPHQLPFEYDDRAATDINAEPYDVSALGLNTEHFGYNLTTGAITYTYEERLRWFARQLLPRFGDGPVIGEFESLHRKDLAANLRPFAVAPGDFVVLDMTSYPNLQGAVYGGERVVQILTVEDHVDGHVFSYLDAGPIGQVLTTPGITFTLDAVDTKHKATIAVTGVPASGRTMVELGVGANPTQWAPVGELVGANGSIVLENLAAGGTYRARAYSLAPDRIPSAVATSAAITTAALLAPTAPAGTVDGLVVHFTFTDNETTERHALFLDGVFITYLPPGSDRFTFQGLQPLTAYLFGVEAHDMFGGKSARAAVSRTTGGNPTSTLDRPQEVRILQGALTINDRRVPHIITPLFDTGLRVHVEAAESFGELRYQIATDLAFTIIEREETISVGKPTLNIRLPLDRVERFVRFRHEALGFNPSPWSPVVSAFPTVLLPGAFDTVDRRASGVAYLEVDQATGDLTVHLDTADPETDEAFWEVSTIGYPDVDETDNQVTSFPASEPAGTLATGTRAFLTARFRSTTYGWGFTTYDTLLYDETLGGIIPNVREQITEAAGTATLTLVVEDPQSRITQVQFNTQSGPAAWSGWAVDAAPYAASVSTHEEHVSKIAYRVFYTDVDGSARVIEQVVTFDADTDATVDTATLSFEADDGEVIVSAGGDSDTASIIGTIDINNTPSNPGPGAGEAIHFTINARAGVIGTGVLCPVGSKAIVKVRGRNSALGLGIIRTVEAVRNNTAQLTLRQRTALATNQDLVDVFVTPMSTESELVRVHYKDGTETNPTGGGAWSLVTANGNPAARWVASGTEIGPTDWFYDGATYKQALNDRTLARDQITVHHAQVEGQTSGRKTPWIPVVLAVKQQPWIESVELTWDEAIDQLRYRVVAGAHCASLKVEISDDDTFATVDSTSYADRSDGQTLAGTYALVTADRQKTWYVRITPYNRVLSGGLPQGIAGVAVRASAYVQRLPAQISMSARQVLNTNRTAADTYVTVQSSESENLRLHYKDAFSTAAIWSAVVANGNPAALWVASGTEIGPSTWFYNGTTYSQPFSAASLTRDQIHVHQVMAEGQSSGYQSSWEPLIRLIRSQPWLESINLAWDEAADQLVARIVGGAHCGSVTVEFSDDGTFATVDSSSNANLADGAVLEVTYALSTVQRGRPWLLRVTPFNLALSGGVPAGNSGVAQRDAVLVPAGESGGIEPPTMELVQTSHTKTQVVFTVTGTLGAGGATPLSYLYRIDGFNSPGTWSAPNQIGTGASGQSEALPAISVSSLFPKVLLVKVRDGSGRESRPMMMPVTRALLFMDDDTTGKIKKTETFSDGTAPEDTVGSQTKATAATVAANAETTARGLTTGGFNGLIKDNALIERSGGATTKRADATLYDAETGRKYVSGDPEDVVVNGGGQLNENGEAATGWTAGAGNPLYVAVAPAKFGDRHLVIDNGTAADSYRYQDYAVVAEEIWEAVGWVKTPTGLTGTGYGGGLNISHQGGIDTIEAMDNERSLFFDGQTLLIGYKGAVLATWTLIRAVVRVLQSGTIRLYVQNGMVGTITGSLHIDGITFRKLKPAEAARFATIAGDYNGPYIQQEAGAHDGASVKSIPKGASKTSLINGQVASFDTPFQNTPIIIPGTGATMEQRAKWGTLTQADANGGLGSGASAAPTAALIRQMFRAEAGPAGFTSRLRLAAITSITPRTAVFAAPTSAGAIGAVTGNATPASANVPAYDDTYSTDVAIYVDNSGYNKAVNGTVTVSLEVQIDGTGSWIEIASAQISYSIAAFGDVLYDASLVGTRSGIAGGNDLFRVKLKAATGGAANFVTVTPGTLNWSSAGVTYASATPNGASDSVEFFIVASA